MALTLINVELVFLTVIPVIEMTTQCLLIRGNDWLLVGPEPPFSDRVQFLFWTLLAFLVALPGSRLSNNVS
jgi:hypothetical protein